MIGVARLKAQNHLLVVAELGKPGHRRAITTHSEAAEGRHLQTTHQHVEGLGIAWNPSPILPSADLAA